MKKRFTTVLLMCLCTVLLYACGRQPKPPLAEEDFTVTVREEEEAEPEPEPEPYPISCAVRTG